MKVLLSIIFMFSFNYNLLAQPKEKKEVPLKEIVKGVELKNIEHEAKLKKILADIEKLEKKHKIKKRK